MNSLKSFQSIFNYILLILLCIVINKFLFAQFSPFADEELSVRKNNVSPTDTNTATTSSSQSTNSSQKSPPRYVPAPSPGKYGISAGSPNFSEWFINAAKYINNWHFPELINKFGEKITQEDFLRAIIWIESNGVHKLSNGKLVRSAAGAIGFMQLMPATAKGLGVNPSDPQQNLIGGVKLLNQIFNLPTVQSASGEEKLIRAVIAYNAGPYSSALKKGWDNLKITGRPLETLGYGLKLKMCLGLPLASDEKNLVSRIFGVKLANVETFADDEFYAPTKGIAR